MEQTSTKSISGTWGGGFRPVMAAVYVKLFPTLIRNLLRREVPRCAWPGAGKCFVPLWSLNVPCWTMFLPSFCESSSYSGVPCVLTGSFLFSLQNEVNLELKTRQETRPWNLRKVGEPSDCNGYVTMPSWVLFSSVCLSHLWPAHCGRVCTRTSGAGLL